MQVLKVILCGARIQRATQLTYRHALKAMFMSIHRRWRFFNPFTKRWNLSKIQNCSKKAQDLMSPLLTRPISPLLTRSTSPKKRCPSHHGLCLGCRNRRPLYAPQTLLSFLNSSLRKDCRATPRLRHWAVRDIATLLGCSQLQCRGCWVPASVFRRRGTWCW